MFKTHENQGIQTAFPCACCTGVFRALLKKSLIIFSVFMMMACPVMADVPAGYTERTTFPTMSGEDYMKEMSIYKNAAIAANMLGITSGEILAEPVYVSVVCQKNQYLSGNTCLDCPPDYPNSNGTSDGIKQCYMIGERVCIQKCSCSENSTCTCDDPCVCQGDKTYMKYFDGRTTDSTDMVCVKPVASASCNAGYYLNNNACTACPKGTYKADSGNATSCTVASDGYYVSTTGATSQTQCPAGYRGGSDNGRDEVTDCYSDTKSRSWTGSQVNGTVPTGCSVTEWNSCSKFACEYVAYSNETGNGDGALKSGCATNNESCTKTVKTVSANNNYYVEGTTCKACSSEYPNSEGGNIGATQCYKIVPRGCTQTQCTCSGNSTCVCADCECTGNGTYKEYSNGTTEGDTSNYTCNQTVAGETCGAGYYMNNGTCTACPKGTYKADSGNATSCTAASEGYYVDTTGATSQKQCPAGYRGGSDNGRDEVTDCYSDTKSRSWTGSQVNGTVPTGCSVTEWNSCSKSACEYVAYSNETGNGDGALKSGCATNNESCTKTVKTVSANNNYYVEGTTCKACSSEYPNSEGGNIGATQCYYTCQSKTVQNASSVTPVSEKIYNNGGFAQVCTYNVICNNGYTASGNGTANPSCDVTTITCPAGQYLPANGTACSVCPENNYCVGNTFDYPKAFAQGITECPTGLVAPQGTTSAAGCGKIMYVDGTKLYLTSEKQTSPALAVRIDGVVYYANMTSLASGAKPMNSATSKSLRTRINGIEYSIHDNTVQGE